MRGFRGKYFSLAAILACSTGVALASEVSSIKANDEDAKMVLASDKEGESEDIDMETIYITAVKKKKAKEFSSSRTLKQTNKSTELVSVITNEEITLKGFQTIPQVLNSISGISTSSNGGAGQISAAYTRGLHSAHTLVLIDGIRVNDITGLNGAQIELIDMFDVERIEIVKGSQSGVWGADASAGVVNIITKKAKRGVSANTNVEFGSNSWQKYNGGFGFSNEIFDISFGASYIKTKGISAAAPTKNSADYGTRAEDLGWERDGFESSSLHVKSGVNITDNDRLEFFIRNTKSKIHFDGGAGVDEEDYGTFGEYFNTVNTNLYSLGYVGDYNKHKINVRANYSGFRKKFYNGYIGSEYEIYASDEFNYFNNSTLFFGAGYLKDKVERSAGAKLPYNSQENEYLFLSNSNQLGNFIFSQSLRYDDYNRFDDRLTGKIGLRYNFYNDWFVLGSYKTGYKTPTLYQQTYGVTSNLDAEKTKGYEITFGNKNFDITYFDIHVKDSIEYDGTSYPNDYYYNLKGKSQFKGIEVSTRAEFFDKFLAEVSYTYLDAKDSSGKDISRRPENKIDASFIWFVNKNINMNLRTSYIGKRYDINGIQTGKYFLSDFVINYESDKNIDFYLKVNNLFDKYYQEVDGYGTYGRSLYFGVRAGF